ncbi:DUF1638 domain-containing protein [Paradesulfitobacterium ferrireducens]|uniref:DUF1638 domain-containing protein n=1 Tax=Paradesulfitobacterium ferrireducens TaxID=2816476 RepID=UPI001A8F147E|nr:DUF1638 domain-containing protein [Paradesulfitobacterium ferrireducens]
MKLKLIGCQSTMNEVRWLGIDQEMDSEFLDYSFHARPDKLHRKLQELIDQSQDYDLIILTYGRCSNSVVGLVSPRVPLLFPATHDCIGLMLGSNARHMEMFRENSLTYYFSQGWLDYGRTPYAEYLEYVEQFGEKKAKKLIEALYGRYQKAVLIKTPGMRDLEGYRQQVKEIADFFGWKVGEIEGDLNLLNAVVRGKKAAETVYVEPGKPVTLEMLRSERYEN